MLNCKNFFHNSFYTFLLVMFYNFVGFIVSMPVDVVLKRVFLLKQGEQIVWICCSLCGAIYIAGLVFLYWLSKQMLKDTGSVLCNVASVFLIGLVELLLLYVVVQTDYTILPFVSFPFDTFIYILRVGFCLQIEPQDFWYYLAGLMPFAVIAMPSIKIAVKTGDGSVS